MLFNDVRRSHESDQPVMNSDGPWKTEGRKTGAGKGGAEEGVGAAAKAWLRR